MLKQRFSRAEMTDIFNHFNSAVHQGSYKKLNYKSWRNIQTWLTDEKWQEFEVSRTWVRVPDEIANNKYDYHDEERIFIGPYSSMRIVPNPEELALDGSFGNWLDYELAIKNISTDSSTHTSVDMLNAWDMNNIKYGTISTTNLIQTEKKENKEMKFNFDFGPVDSSVRMSLYGMAIKNAAGTYVAYDAKSKQVMDVDILNFEGANKLMYKMPVALKDVRSGDVVVHNRKPCFVQMVCDDNRFKVLDIFDGEEKTIVPARSPFGWDFLTKVVCLYNFNNADTNNPFGNMLPLLLLSDGKTDDMLPFLLMSQNGADFATNPMLMYALMSGKGNNDMLPFLLMSGFNAPTTAKPE